MTWQMYRWVWQVCSPIHLGFSPAGALNRTRLYIPARTIWGALTAEIARRRGGINFPEYEETGRELIEQARFTYLFPAEQVYDTWKVWLPNYVEGGFQWQREDGERKSEREFRRLLLTTYPGTAINPSSDTAEEGTLREMECIQPFWHRKGEMSPVAFVGYVFFADEKLYQEINEVLELLLGADTRYGFGRIKRICSERETECFGKTVKLSVDNPQVYTDTILGHLKATDITFKGSFEILQQWDKVNIQTAGITWTPGSKFSSFKNFEILPSGLWKEV